MSIRAHVLGNIIGGEIEPSSGVEDYYKHDQQEQAEDDDARIPPESLFYVHGYTLFTYWLKFDL
jgi:hypothetical protein